jgi:hypothetical protein
VKVVRLGIAVVAVSALASAIGMTATAGNIPVRCASAWNHTAPNALRARIVASHPRGAFIDPHGSSVMSVTWTKAGQSSSSASGCGIQFVLHDGHVLAVWGAWANGGVAKWVGPVSSGRAVPLATNANVHADGTVGFHG